MSERDPDLFPVDEELCLLDISLDPGPDVVRVQARMEDEPYRPEEELYPLVHAGTKTGIVARAYALLEDIGTKPHRYEPARMRAWYFHEDRALAMWDVEVWGEASSAFERQLWQGFEQWLVKRYPDAARIFTDDLQPVTYPGRKWALLESLGYQRVDDRVYVKGLEPASGPP